MKHRKPFLTLLAAVVSCLASAPTAFANGIEGQWTGEFDSPRGDQKYFFTFKVTDGKLTATASAEMGDQKREVEFLDERIEGDTVTFAELRRIQDNEIRIEYTGKVSDKGIAFTRKVGDFGQQEFEASRVGAPPAPAAEAKPSITNIAGQDIQKFTPMAA